MSMKILLIDNAEQELAVLKSPLRQAKAAIAHVVGLNDSVRALSQHKFNLVICASEVDNRASEMILAMVAKKFPTMVRIAISNTPTPVNNAHKSFMLPIVSKEVLTSIAKLTQNNRAITKDIIVKTVANVKTLPSPPKVYMQLNSMLSASTTDSDKVAQIIQQDPALTAKVLQFVNNTFANKKPVTDISEAITKMGLDTLCCIVMTAELFSYQPKIKDFSIVKEQLHSLAVAKFAASMVDDALKQDTLIAGLLHDLGKVILFELDSKATDRYVAQLSSKRCRLALEQEVFATDHCHVGGYLLHTWGFSYHIIEAVILHHNPSKLCQERFGIAQAVYLANTLLHQQAPSEQFISHFKLESTLDKLKQRALKYHY